MIRTLSIVALVAAALLAPGVAHAQAPGCEVESATLDWGFKESFRGYIDGSIANGEWTVADGATYETPSFGFPSMSGRVDPRDPNGSVGFAGSVRFTGHGDILDTTIANPVLVVRPDGSGLLLLDVSGPTMEGDPVDVREAPFVTIDLAGQDLTPVDGIITIDDAPTKLTAEGEAAFPNYPEGEAFDPVTVTMDVGECDLTGQPIGTDVIDTGDEGAVASLPWPVVVALAIAAVVIVIVVLLLTFARRRR